MEDVLRWDAWPKGVLFGVYAGVIFPQTVLALWGSGVFKAGDPNPGFPASRTFPDTENH